MKLTDLIPLKVYPSTLRGSANEKVFIASSLRSGLLSSIRSLSAGFGRYGAGLEMSQLISPDSQT